MLAVRLVQQPAKLLLVLGRLVRNRVLHFQMQLKISLAPVTC
jgi:hypothetical protein